MCIRKARRTARSGSTSSGRIRSKQMRTGLSGEIELRFSLAIRHSFQDVRRVEVPRLKVREQPSTPPRVIQEVCSFWDEMSVDRRKSKPCSQLKLPDSLHLRERTKDFHRRELANNTITSYAK